jgi:signal transduction histidine kinase
MANLAQRLYQPWKNLPIRVRGAVIIAIPVTCMFTALSAFAWLKASLAEDETWVQHTQTVRLETKQLVKALVDAETGVRGYGLTRREEFLEPYQWAQTEIPSALNRLETLVSDNPPQVERVQEIRQLADENLAIFQQKLFLKQELHLVQEEPNTLVPAAALYAWLEEGKETMDATREAIDRFMEVEEALLAQRIQHRDRYQQMAWLALCLLVVIGTLAALFAIHLLHQLERELADREDNLKATNHRLENACSQLQRFTANASHELRAPLAAVLSNAQVGLMAIEDFEQEFPDPDDQPRGVRPRLENIVSLTKKMSTLVSELLFLARQEGLLAPEDLQIVDLTGLVAQLTSDWQTEAQAHDLRLSAELPVTTVLVNADPNLLRQAITNLLSNACRYTPAGGKIQLCLLQRENQAVIEVQDTGIGIPNESLPMIFERFYRVDSKRAKASGGLGLGLAIVEQIVQAHRGHIDIASILGEGSTFSISLPLAMVEPEPIQAISLVTPVKAIS